MTTASTDGTAQLVEMYKPLDCELIRSRQNEGLFRNFNKALSYATGATTCITSALTTYYCQISWEQNDYRTCGCAGAVVQAIACRSS
ncbi:MAG: hypothetical protein Ct9H300mP7_1580 [Verrucomicrobiota bacterium]|nr:MAG: hypothetical protein Ct9H300mP7_1580 [Verrucomicrobiota bacterium]